MLVRNVVIYGVFGWNKNVADAFDLAGSEKSNSSGKWYFWFAGFTLVITQHEYGARECKRGKIGTKLLTSGENGEFSNARLQLFLVNMLAWGEIVAYGGHRKNVFENIKTDLGRKSEEMSLHREGFVFISCCRIFNSWSEDGLKTCRKNEN